MTSPEIEKYFILKTNKTNNKALYLSELILVTATLWSCPVVGGNRIRGSARLVYLKMKKD